MFGLSFNQFFQQKIHLKNHLTKIRCVKSTINRSPPKQKLRCTKQPLSEFNRIYQMQLQNKNLYKKIVKPQSNLENNVVKYKLIKNNRKHYYEQHQRKIQNQGLLRRIKSAKTSYSKKRLESQRKQNQQYLQLLCKFGYKDQKNQHFKYNLDMIKETLQIPLSQSTNQSRLLRKKSQVRIRGQNNQNSKAKTVRLTSGQNGQFFCSTQS